MVYYLMCMYVCIYIYIYTHMRSHGAEHVSSKQTGVLHVIVHALKTWADVS